MTKIAESLAKALFLGTISASMKTLSVVLVSLLLMPSILLARGGGGFGGGGFREGGMDEGEFRGDDTGFRDEAARPDTDFGNNLRNDTQVTREPDGGENVQFDDGNRSADARITPEGDGTANVNVRTINGRDYDANVVGPDGFRNGYVWQNGNYVAVDLTPWSFYAAPYGPFAGWSVMTSPDYVQYPVYSTYPVETAVQVALQKLGLYNGPVDGIASSCSGAIEQYQMQNGMPVTGTISPELLTALGIQANYQ